MHQRRISKQPPLGLAEAVSAKLLYTIGMVLPSFIFIFLIFGLPLSRKGTLVPATGHGKTEITGAKEATCTAEGYTGDKICTICKEVIGKGTVTKKKAHTYKEGKCTVCGTADPNYKSSDSKKQSATTVTGSSVDSNKTNNSNTNSPQTGDNTQIVLWVVLMAGAIFVIAGSLIVYKKKQ